MPDLTSPRENEYLAICEFLDGCLESSRGGGMYIAGTPGTGMVFNSYPRFTLTGKTTMLQNLMQERRYVRVVVLLQLILSEKGDLLLL